MMKEDLEKLEAVNRTVNSKIRYVRDDGPDYWQSPEETLERGTGDCEDFVILKFHELVKAGVDPDKMYFCYCKIGDIRHVVLGYGTRENPLILDCRNEEIRPMRECDFVPIFCFDSDQIQRVRQWVEMEARRAV